MTIYQAAEASVRRRSVKLGKSFGNELLAYINKREKEMKSKRGGKRKGSGRPKKEKTKVMRVPISLISHVVGLIKSKA